MSDLVLHSRTIDTIFDLLGHRENDMTAALGWVLARHPGFLGAFLAQVSGPAAAVDRC